MYTFYISPASLGAGLWVLYDGTKHKLGEYSSAIHAADDVASGHSDFDMWDDELMEANPRVKIPKDLSDWTKYV